MWRSKTACVALLAYLSLVVSCKPRVDDSEVQSTDSDSQNRLDDLVFRSTFVGINAALSAFDSGRLDFLVKAYNVIASLPYDPRFSADVKDATDQWSPLACVKIVQWQRAFKIPVPQGGGVSKCLTNIDNFETKAGALVEQAVSAYDKALEILPGDSVADKIFNLRKFYENFGGGPTATVDQKVATATALFNIYIDYSKASTSSTDLSSYSTILVWRIDLILRYASTLTGGQNYLNGRSFDLLFQQLNKKDLRTVLKKLLRETQMDIRFQGNVIAYYDYYNGEVNPPLPPHSTLRLKASMNLCGNSSAALKTSSSLTARTSPKT